MISNTNSRNVRSITKASYFIILKVAKGKDSSPIQALYDTMTMLCMTLYDYEYEWLSMTMSMSVSQECQTPSLASLTSVHVPCAPCPVRPDMMSHAPDTMSHVSDTTMYYRRTNPTVSHDSFFYCMVSLTSNSMVFFLTHISGPRP